MKTKSHKEILESYIELEYEDVLKAMNLAAKQAFEESRKNKWMETDIYDGYYRIKYEKFEDYLKDLEDE